MTSHIYDVDLAIEVGIPAAVLYQNLSFWIEKNAANEDEKHYQEGRYWTWNSVNAFAVIFPEMGSKTIRSALKKLVDAGFIITGSFNKSKYDRTTWYALGDRMITDLPKRQMDKAKGKMDVPKSENQSAPEGEPIPDVTSDVTSDVNTSDMADAPAEHTAPPEVIMLFPTNRFSTTGESFSITDTLFARWVQLYPAVDVGQQIRNMAGWLESNPTQRKTLSGMPSFINRWLAKEQNRGGQNTGSQQTPQSGKTRDRSLKDDLDDRSWANRPVEQGVLDQVA